MNEIRRTWEEIGTRLENRGSNDYNLNRRETALERLKRKYLNFSRLALAFIIVWPCSLHGLHDVVEGWALTLSIVFCIYFGVASAMDYWLYKGISSIDCYTMTVKEVVDKAYYYRKMHLRFIATLLPMALICVGMLGWAMRGEPFLIGGMLTGGILGLVLGYRHYLDFMSEYRRIRE